MFFGGLTIDINGFSMVFEFCYHCFQWFSMVPDHWSNDAMVSMDRCGLTQIQIHKYKFTNTNTQIHLQLASINIGPAFQSSAGQISFM